MTALDFPRNAQPTSAPPDRGRLLRADEVRELMDRAHSVDWIYKNLHAGRRNISRRCVRWREYDVLEWLEQGAA